MVGDMTQALATVDLSSEIERSDDPGAFVVLACERAKSWLTQAIEHGKLDDIVDIKSKTAAILVYTRQKELGKDAELAASEIIRRAERAIGLCIAQGQRDGVVARHGGDTSKIPDGNLASPSAFVSGARERCDVKIFAGTTDVDFDEAIETAKAEGSLSRANVLRKLGRDYSAEARAERAKPNATPAPKQWRTVGDPNFKKRHLKADRLVAETVIALDGVCSALDLVDISNLNPERIEEWATSFSKSIARINRFRKEMARVQTG